MKVGTRHTGVAVGGSGVAVGVRVAVGVAVGGAGVGVFEGVGVFVAVGGSGVADGVGVFDGVGVAVGAFCATWMPELHGAELPEAMLCQPMV
jgi:hypothetical protein